MAWPRPSGLSGQELNAATQLLLEEYRTVRGEVAASIQAQHQALSYGVAALALVLVAISQIWNSAPGLASLALMTVVPGGIYFLVAVWGTELARMIRASFYLASYLEPQINSVAGLPYELKWSRWATTESNPAVWKDFAPRRLLAWVALRRGKAHRLAAGYLSIVLILTLLSITVFVVGAARFGRVAEQRRLAASQKNGPELTWYYEHWRWDDFEPYAVLLSFVVFPTLVGVRSFLDGRRPYGEGDLPEVVPPIANAGSGGAAPSSGPGQ